MSGTFQIVCAHCGQINRLPVARAAKAARCGACAPSEDLRASGAMNSQEIVARTSAGVSRFDHAQRQTRKSMP